MRSFGPALAAACLLLSITVADARVPRPPKLNRRGPVPAATANQEKQLVKARQFDPSRRPSVALHARQGGPSPIPCGVGFLSTAQGCTACDALHRFDAGPGECGSCLGGYFERSGSCAALAPICAAQGRAVGSASCGACLNPSFLIGNDGVCAAPPPPPPETCADPNATTAPSGACSTCKDGFTATATGCQSCISLGLRPGTQGQCRSGCTRVNTFLDTATGECACNAGTEPDAARPGQCRISCTRVNTHYDPATDSCVCNYGSQPDPYPQTLPAQCQTCSSIFRSIDTSTGRCNGCIDGYMPQVRLCVPICTALNTHFDSSSQSCVCNFGSEPDPMATNGACRTCDAENRTTDPSTGACTAMCKQGFIDQSGTCVDLVTYCAIRGRNVFQDACGGCTAGTVYVIGSNGFCTIVPYTCADNNANVLPSGQCGTCKDGFSYSFGSCRSCESQSLPDGTGGQCGAACVPPLAYDPFSKLCS